MTLKTIIPLAAAMSFGAASLHAADNAQAEVHNTDGVLVGGVSAEETASGMTLLTISLDQLPPGIHGVHIHEVGDCSAADFSSAGGHLAGDATHGIKSEDGPHPGDLPNITVLNGGAAEVEVFTDLLRVNDHLLDEDGAAFVVHSGIDDYQSQPSGDAGDRIACGVFIGE